MVALYADAKSPISMDVARGFRPHKIPNAPLSVRGIALSQLPHSLPSAWTRASPGPLPASLSAPFSEFFSAETSPQLIDSSSQHRSVAFQAAMPPFLGAFFQVSHPIPPRRSSVALNSASPRQI